MPTRKVWRERVIDALRNAYANSRLTGGGILTILTAGASRTAVVRFLVRNNCLIPPGRVSANRKRHPYKPPRERKWLGNYLLFKIDPRMVEEISHQLQLNLPPLFTHPSAETWGSELGYEGDQEQRPDFEWDQMGYESAD